MLFGAAHARSEVLETVHVEPSAPVAWRQNALPFAQTLHSVDHLDLVGTAIVLLCWLARALARSW